MNPAQYKQAMRQRALERRAELNREEAASPSERSLGAPHPPGTDTSAELKLQGNDVDDGSAATSPATCSSTGGCGLDEGFCIRNEHGQPPPHLCEEGLSPLAPGPLTDGWSSHDARPTGFDKQATPNSASGGRSLSLGDGESEGEDDSGFGGGSRLQSQHGRVRVLDWDDKLPGETTITQSVRLYLSSVNGGASHEKNCGLVLHQILEHVAREELDTPSLKTRHTIKIEAFLRSVVLSVPSRTWQQSVRGALARTTPASISISPGHGHQISKEELTFRMSLFVALMRAERNGTDEADVAVDAMRVESVLRGYAANAAEILPLQRPARTLLPPLLFCMACEVLHVRLLAPEVRQVCRQIVSDYEARAKLWMNPAQNADRYLRPLVTEFASWLRANKDILYQGSATEGLLRSIDERLRISLKNQVYRSPEHFLQVLHSLSDRLTDMPLPSYDPSGGDDHPFDVCQTLKDVSRERFDVNNAPTDPGHCWPHIRALLLRAAVQNLQQPRDRTARSGDNAAQQLGAGGSGFAANPAAAAAAEETKSLRKTRQYSERSSGVGADFDTGTLPADPAAAAAAAAENAALSGGTGGRGGCGGGARAREEGGVKKRSGVANGAKGVTGDAHEGVPKSPLEEYVDQCAWRVLHAASRTASGGDSFFVVQDLFGGEGVLVKMATAPTEPIRIRTKGLSVRVTTIDKHDIYHISDIDISSGASPLPLMTITTTMKEFIQFAPFFEPPLPDLMTEGAGSSSLEQPAQQQQQQQQQQQRPSNARSGRFITISAELPNYPENHLDASAGVLLAPSNAPLSDTEEALRGGDLPPAVAVTTPVVTVPGDAGASPAGSDNGAHHGASITSSKPSTPESTAMNIKPLHRRPSVYKSPPETPPTGRKVLNASGSESESESESLSGSHSRGASEGESTVGSYEEEEAGG
ncbi:unnamed protein product [Pylaiella littoralis]